MVVTEPFNLPFFQIPDTEYESFHLKRKGTFARWFAIFQIAGVRAGIGLTVNSERHISVSRRN